MAIAFRAAVQSSAIAGAQASPALGGFSNGDLVLLWCVGDSITDPVADPAGWTRLVRGSLGAERYWLGWRVKQAGDANVPIGGGGAGNTAAYVVGYSGGAIVGELSPSTDDATPSTAWDAGPVTIDNSGSMSVVFAAAGNGLMTSIPPALWTERAETGFSTVTLTVVDRGPGLAAGPLDPGPGTWSGNAQLRTQWQVELTDPAVVEARGAGMLLGVG